jgi:hypothetical protein
MTIKVRISNEHPKVEGDERAIKVTPVAPGELTLSPGNVVTSLKPGESADVYVHHGLSVRIDEP